MFPFNIDYNQKDIDLYYWRSINKFEVDLIIRDEMAIDIKASENVSRSHIKGLKAFKEEQLVKSYLVISADKFRRTIDGRNVIYWEDFLKEIFPSLSGN